MEIINSFKTVGELHAQAGQSVYAYGSAVKFICPVCRSKPSADKFLLRDLTVLNSAYTSAEQKMKASSRRQFNRCEACVSHVKEKMEKNNNFHQKKMEVMEALRGACSDAPYKDKEIYHRKLEALCDQESVLKFLSMEAAGRVTYRQEDGKTFFLVKVGNEWLPYRGLPQLKMDEEGEVRVARRRAATHLAKGGEKESFDSRFLRNPELQGLLEESGTLQEFVASCNTFLGEEGWSLS